MSARRFPLPEPSPGERRPSPPPRRGRRRPTAAERARARRERRRQLVVVVTRRAQRRRPAQRRRLLGTVLLALCAVSALAISGAGAAAWEYSRLQSSLPDIKTLASMEPALNTHVYANDGRTLIADLHGSDYDHEHADLDRLSPWVVSATVDVEDRHFYENQSVDVPRIVKAAWDNLRGSGEVQGASTITQQLAKVSFLSFEQSIERKLKELILGAQIEQNYSKRQILDMYLNRVAYGNFAVGVESAARNYFHKSASQVDLAEAALLAGLPNAPSQYNPLLRDAPTSINPLAKQRQRVVLDAMVANGDVSRDRADAAFKEDLAPELHYAGDAEPQVAPGFVGYLRQWLQSHYGDAPLNPGGWNVVTTLNLPLQGQAEAALACGIGGANGACPPPGTPLPQPGSLYTDKNARDGALVSIDPQTGEVVAMVGSWNAADPAVSQLNLATSQAQPGSTIKVFTYTAAIASRQFTPATTVIDGPISLPIPGSAPYAPLDYDRRWHGACQLQQCLGNSLNVPAVKVQVKVGIPTITDLEIAAGLTSLADHRPSPFNYAATLGGLEVGISPLELANGVAMLAALGVHHDAVPVRLITDQRSGRPVFAHDPNADARRVVPDAVAYIMNQMTSNDANRALEFGSGGALTLPGRRVSAKTGTTESFVSNWTVGWTPQLATAVMVGNPSPNCPSPIGQPCGPLQGSTGITGAAPIWHAYMAQALAPLPPVWYPKPAGVEQVGPGDDALFLLTGTDPKLNSEAAPAPPKPPAPAPPPVPVPVPVPAPLPPPPGPGNKPPG